MSSNPNANGGKANRSQRRSARADNGKGSANGGEDKGRSSSRRRKGPRKRRVDPQAFWGDPAKLAEHEPAGALITTNPSAVVQSLGRPPLSGHQNAAEHYFVAVYDRAVNLAAALAAAGSLVHPEELSDR